MLAVSTGIVELLVAVTHVTARDVTEVSAFAHECFAEFGLLAAVEGGFYVLGVLKVNEFSN